MNTFSVSIVIPNWNGRELLEKHLPHVIAAGGDAEIIISDDASSDGSVAYVRKNFPDIRVVTNSRARGFAGNVNTGVATAHGDICVLLNTDVRPEKQFLAPLLNRFSDEKTAAVGCLDRSHDQEGLVLRGRGVARWKRGLYVHTKGDTESEDTAWVSGGSSAFRRSVWMKLGGMDELYSPFYWEDIDLSYRLRKAGYRIYFERKSIVDHYHETGKIKTSFSPSQVKRIAYRNQFLFVWKNASDPYVLASHIAWTPIHIFRAVLSGDLNMPAGYLMAVLRPLQLAAARRRSSRHWHLSDRELDI